MPSSDKIRNVPFVLFGAGGVGSALLRAVLTGRALHCERYGLRFTAVGACDSSGVLRPGSSGELSDAALERLIEYKAGGGKLAELTSPPDEVAARPSSRARPTSSRRWRRKPAPTTPAASSSTARRPTRRSRRCWCAPSPARPRAASAKEPFASSLDVFNRLGSGPRAPGRVRFESTVCAGVPVVAAMQRTVAAADAVSRVAGSFSGTLGYVMSGLQGGGKFSEVVSKAKDLGYTEPDPRDDLGGVDVARKVRAARFGAQFGAQFGAPGAISDAHLRRAIL